MTDTEMKRLHPLKILASIISFIKGSFVIIIYLFFISDKESTIAFYGRWAFALFVIISFIQMILQWWSTKYELKTRSIHISKGVFKKKSNSIPLERVQNVQTSTPWYFKPFSVTSLTLVTSATDEDASVKLEAVKKEEAEKIENQVLTLRKESAQVKIGDACPIHEQALEKQSRILSGDMSDAYMQLETSERTVHFRPSRKDLLKASFLSLSFLALIPIIATIINNAEDIFNWKMDVEEVYVFIADSWLLIGTVIILFLVIAVGFGITRTFLKYGKYEIASDHERIYIKRGTLSEQSFSIRKENVQGIQLNQNPFKKLLKLTEVKLVSAVNDDDDGEEINTLYPFLPTNRAFGLIEELLPGFQVENRMNKLPKQALYVKLLRFPFVWLIITGILFWWKPAIFGWSSTWIYVVIILLISTYAMRALRFKNSRYLINDGFIQFKVGGLWSETFITKRKKVIEIEVEQSFLQRKFGVATIKTVNRTNPVHHEEMQDIPVDASNEFIHWYHERSKEITTE